MTSANPGVVFVKTDRDADEINIQGIRAGVHFTRDELPEVIEPRGLSQQRQAYLFKTVRPFVRPLFQESLCPALPNQ